MPLLPGMYRLQMRVIVELPLSRIRTMARHKHVSLVPLTLVLRPSRPFVSPPLPLPLPLLSLLPLSLSSSPSFPRPLSSFSSSVPPPSSAFLPPPSSSPPSSSSSPVVFVLSPGTLSHAVPTEDFANRTKSPVRPTLNAASLTAMREMDPHSRAALPRRFRQRRHSDLGPQWNWTDAMIRERSRSRSDTTVSPGGTRELR